VGRSLNSKNVTFVVKNTIAAAIWSVEGNVTATWREDATLPCHSVGYPKPKKFWRMNGILLKDLSIRG